MNATSQHMLRPMMAAVGLNENFFCLTICTLDQYLKNNSEKNGFAPIDSNAKTGPPLPITICRENSDAMCEFTEISGPAYSVLDAAI